MLEFTLLGSVSCWFSLNILTCSPRSSGNNIVLHKTTALSAGTRNCPRARTVVPHLCNRLLITSRCGASDAAALRPACLSVCNTFPPNLRVQQWMEVSGGFVETPLVNCYSASKKKPGAEHRPAGVRKSVILKLEP